MKSASELGADVQSAIPSSSIFPLRDLENRFLRRLDTILVLKVDSRDLGTTYLF